MWHPETGPLIPVNVPGLIEALESFGLLGDDLERLIPVNVPGRIEASRQAGAMALSPFS